MKLRSEFRSATVVLVLLAFAHTRAETLHEVLPQASASEFTTEFRVDAFSSLAGDLNSTSGDRLGSQDLQDTSVRFESQYGITPWLSLGGAFSYGSDLRVRRFSDGISSTEDSSGFGGLELLSRWRVPLGLTTLLRSRFDISVPLMRASRPDGSGSTAGFAGNRQPEGTQIALDLGVETLWNGLNWGVYLLQGLETGGEVAVQGSGSSTLVARSSRWVPGARLSVEVPVDDGLIGFEASSVWLGDRVDDAGKSTERTIAMGRLATIAGRASYQMSPSWEVIGGGSYTSWLGTENLGGRTSLNGVSFDVGLRYTLSNSRRVTEVATPLREVRPDARARD